MKKLLIIFIVHLAFSLFSQEPLFDVKDDSGTSIFSVYPDGIKIRGMSLNYNDDPDSLRFELSDSEGKRLLLANSDSVRFYLYDAGLTDESRGGFAIATVGSTTDTEGDKIFDLTDENYFIGHQSGVVTTGLYNCFMGYQTGLNNTEGDHNLFFGYQSGHNNINGRLNSFFGFKAGFANVGGSGNEGNYNVFMGNESGIANQTGYHNTFVGHYSGHGNISGYANTFLGSSTGYNSTGIRNTYVGSGSNVMGSDGSFNTFVGSWSGQFNNGSDNVLIGFAAGQSSSNGTQNTCLGASSGYNLEGSGNVTLGFRSGYSESGSNRLYIANGGTIDSTLVYGEFDNDLLVFNANYVGVGTNEPDELLHVEGGKFKIGTGETIEDGGNWTIRVNSNIVPEIDDSRDLGSASYRWDDVYATNGTIVMSDIREKENIQSIQYGLTELMQLNPVSFNWKGRSAENRKFGLIAQDLLEVVPEVVKTSDEQVIDEETGETETVDVDRYGVYYTDLIPVLIKSIQEQQQMIDELQKEIENLKEK